MNSHRYLAHMNTPYTIYKPNLNRLQTGAKHIYTGETIAGPNGCPLPDLPTHWWWAYWRRQWTPSSSCQRGARRLYPSSCPQSSQWFSGDKHSSFSKSLRAQAYPGTNWTILPVCSHFWPVWRASTRTGLQLMVMCCWNCHTVCTNVSKDITAAGFLFKPIAVVQTFFLS